MEWNGLTSYDIPNITEGRPEGGNGPFSHDTVYFIFMIFLILQKEGMRKGRME
jgi:hypothetical protein